MSPQQIKAPTPSLWFWPLGWIDPDTGRVQLISVGYAADVGGNWTQDGKIIVDATALRSSLWRFRPDAAP
jgi:hypothetical protein